MATKNKKISKAVEGALKQMKKNTPEEFSKLNADPQLKDAITEAARATATEELQLADEFASKPDQDIRKRLSKHLPEDRIKLIEEALSIPTFRMEITKSDGKYWVQLTRKGEEFLPGRELATLADTEWSSIRQEASILVEAVLLATQAVSISDQSLFTAWGWGEGTEDFGCHLLSCSTKGEH